MHKQAWYGLFSRLRNYQSSKTSISVLMGQGSVPLERSVVDGICQALQSLEILVGSHLSLTQAAVFTVFFHMDVSKIHQGCAC